MVAEFDSVLRVLLLTNFLGVRTLPVFFLGVSKLLVLFLGVSTISVFDREILLAGLVFFGVVMRFVTLVPLAVVLDR